MPKRHARYTQLDPAGWAALAVILLLVLCAVTPGIFAAQDPLAIAATHGFTPPSFAHPFGTDESGRDLLSRVIFGARDSLTIGAAATLAGLLTGIILGALAAGSRGSAMAPIRFVADRAIEALFAFPALLLALLLISVRGPGTVSTVIAVAVSTAPGYARMVRGGVRQAFASGPVEAARLQGDRAPRVWAKHILPEALPPVLLLATLGIGQAVVLAAALGFLGFGTPPPAPEWGAMLNAGRPYLMRAWWMTVFPGLAILITGIGCAVLARSVLRATKVTPARVTHSPQPADAHSPEPADSHSLQPTASRVTGGGQSTPDGPQTAPLLRVDSLSIWFPEYRDPVVDRVSFEIRAGECVALVGESGSGKSLTARALLGVLPENATRHGRLWFRGELLPENSSRAWNRLRGAAIGFVPQSAQAGLDPLRRIEHEVGDVPRLHRLVPRSGRRARVAAALQQMGMPNPVARLRQRSDELSGGLRQRALAAAAVIGNPQLLIADEPTAALDAGHRRQLLAELRRRVDAGAGALLISHDLESVRGIADLVLVMREGRMIERGSPQAVFAAPEQPFTRELVAAAPAGKLRGSLLLPGMQDDGVSVVLNVSNSAAGSDHDARGRDRETQQPLLALQGIQVAFGRGDRARRVLQGASLTVHAGETVGLVGESGSGKTTLLRVALGLQAQHAGRVLIAGVDRDTAHRREQRELRRRLAFVPQHPQDSFPKRATALSILIDALRAAGVAKSARSAQARAFADEVGLDEHLLHREAATLSGGQAQRVAIARALAARATLLLLDEPVSALDYTVQARVLDLLDTVQRRHGIAYLLVSHDADVIEHMSDRVLRLADAQIVESG